MSRLAILVTVQVFFGCLFVGVSPAEDVRPQETSLSKSDALNLAKPIDRQIIIRTQLVEVSLSKMKRLGIDISTFDGQNVRLFSGADVLAGTSVADVLAGASVLGSFPDFMDALRQNGIAHLLAEPTIATMDRQPASSEVRAVEGDRAIAEACCAAR